MNNSLIKPANRRSPLAKRFIFYLILFSASITLITTAIQLYNEYQRDLKGIELQLQQVENVLLRSFTQSLWATNYQELHVQMEGLVKLPNIVYTAVHNGQQLISETGMINSENVIKRQYEMKYDFLDKQNKIGTLTVVTTLDNIYADLLRNARTILFNNALRTFLVVIFIYFIFYHLISRHIAQISQHFQRLALGKTEPLVLVRKSTRKTDELDLLVSSANEMQERINQSHKALRESEKLLRLIHSQVPGVVYQFRVDVNGKKFLPYVSPAVENYIGVTAEAVMDDAETWFGLTHPDDYPGLEKSIVESMTNLTLWKWQGRFIRKDGETICLRGTSTPERMKDGSTLWNGLFIDITERVLADEIIRRTQKMDALGKLTGGIAHDYNNMLGVVLGFSELLEYELADQAELKKYVEQIRHAGERGVKLTNKLLSFSKNKLSNVDTVDINELLKQQQHMLEKTLTARITLEFDLQNNLWLVSLDESELEDTILNISINAMHAIEGNGSLTIKTSNEQVKPAEAESLGLQTGDYVRLSLVDTGCGMDEETKDKIFDPFYSTKGAKGTGLGLTQVYGFINRCGGIIKVDTVIEEGTQFSLYFPRNKNDESISNSSAEVKDDKKLKGKETILIVDDEPALLSLTSKILSQNGYHIFKAEHAKAAMEIMESEHIDILLSDIIMPGIDGFELAAMVKDKYSNVKIQLVSGYYGEHSIEHVDEELSKNILKKPLNAQNLLTRIRSLLQ